MPSDPRCRKCEGDGCYCEQCGEIERVCECGVPFIMPCGECGGSGFTSDDEASDG
jgi:hypothetical protein